LVVLVLIYLGQLSISKKEGEKMGHICCVCNRRVNENTVIENYGNYYCSNECKVKKENENKLNSELMIIC